MENKLTYYNGQIVTAKVIRTGSKFTLLEDKDKNKFIIYKNEITDFRNIQINDILQIRDIVNFVVIGYDQDTKQYIGSFKKNHPNFLRSERYYSLARSPKNELKETKNGFNNLIKFTLSYILPNEENNNDNGDLDNNSEIEKPEQNN
ncbi:hypothetical protein [Mycoplasmopsis verecunda]|uniref:Small subunit ribosomal protein S1 n=1 Tax=Mycoplasmopsis verecunda TaxID=171291 RepID=A0A1T4KKB6_9BACT|nr:hypothetical protein [Mycoplasmopsis verecunda]WPB54259.1 hypothetical protein SAM46_02105 [Mycoplasmopsis verecunda]SJZ42813.1 small subunit ribosomal protein S1 [Mycoplasmopsis verecunda]